MLKDNFVNLIRVAIATVCVILFIMQSYQEVDKFLSRITSVATRKEVINDIPFPRIVVCPIDAFKEGSFPQTTEEYINQTYSSDEIIEHISIYDGDHSEKIENFTEIATFGFGRCVLLEMSENLRHSNWDLHMSMHVPSSLYIVERGQELCLKYFFCPISPTVIDLNDNYMSLIKISAVKKITSDG